MTVKQQKYLKGMVEGKTKKQAALDAGYAESTANSAIANIESFGLKSQFQLACESKNLDLGKIVDILKEGLKATKPIARWSEDYPDYETRLKYLIIALRLWGKKI